MISLEKIKLIEPDLNNLPEEEVVRIHESLYELGQLMFEDWLKNDKCSKYPVGVLQGFEERNKLKPWLTKDQKQE